MLGTVRSGGCSICILSTVDEVVIHFQHRHVTVQIRHPMLPRMLIAINWNGQIDLFLKTGGIEYFPEEKSRSPYVINLTANERMRLEGVGCLQPPSAVLDYHHHLILESNHHAIFDLPTGHVLTVQSLNEKMAMQGRGKTVVQILGICVGRGEVESAR